MKRKDLEIPSIVPYSLLLLLAFAIRWLFLSNLDLRDFPGPASPQVIGNLANLSSSAVGDWDPLLRAALGLFNGDVILTTRVAMMIASLCAVLGAMLAGHALGGSMAALGAGTVAAFWSYSVMLSVMVCFDTLSIGAAWLGMGTAIFASQRGWWSLPFVIAGCLSLVAAITFKEVALPLISIALLLPLLAKGTAFFRGSLAVICTGIIYWSRPAFFRFQFQLPGRPETLGELDKIQSTQAFVGLERLQDALGSGLEADAYYYLIIAAIIGAVIPGQKWIARIALAGASVAILSVASGYLDDWFRLRFLAVPSFPIVLLAGFALGKALDWGPIPTSVKIIPAAAAALCLSWDAIDYAHQWSRIRSVHTIAQPSTLPEPPDFFWARNHIRTGLNFSDFALTGGIEVGQLIAAAGPPPGTATIRLRDERQRHIPMASSLKGIPSATLAQDNCCGSSATWLCAEAVINAINDRGSLLVLPKFTEGDMRLPHQQVDWYLMLKHVAGKKGGLKAFGDRWWTFYGTGEAETALPCGHGWQIPTGNPTPEEYLAADLKEMRTELAQVLPIPLQGPPPEDPSEGAGPVADQKHIEAPLSDPEPPHNQSPPSRGSDGPETDRATISNENAPRTENTSPPPPNNSPPGPENMAPARKNSIPPSDTRSEPAQEADGTPSRHHKPQGPPLDAAGKPIRD